MVARCNVGLFENPTKLLGSIAQRLNLEERIVIQYFPACSRASVGVPLDPHPMVQVGVPCSPAVALFFSGGRQTVHVPHGDYLNLYCIPCIGIGKVRKELFGSGDIGIHKKIPSN